MPEEIKTAEVLDDFIDAEEPTEVEEQGSSDTSRGSAYERETIINFNNAEKRTISAEGHIVPVLSLITTFHSQTIIIKITSTSQRDALSAFR